jgi:hypothetical protein
MIDPRRMRWAEHVARMGEVRNAQQVLVVYLRPCGIPKDKWENNIKMDHKEMGCEDAEWVRVRSGGGGSCEHSNKLSVSVKNGKLVD